MCMRLFSHLCLSSSDVSTCSCCLCTKYRLVSLRLSSVRQYCIFKLAIFFSDSWIWLEVRRLRRSLTVHAASLVPHTRVHSTCKRLGRRFSCNKWLMPSLMFLGPYSSLCARLCAKVRALRPTSDTGQNLGTNIRITFGPFKNTRVSYSNITFFYNPCHPHVTVNIMLMLDI